MPAEQAPQMSPLPRREAPPPGFKRICRRAKTLLDTNVLPDGTDFSDGYIGSIQDRERMAENKFTVYDAWMETAGKSWCPAVCRGSGDGWDGGLCLLLDAQKQALRSQLGRNFRPDIYENGAVKADWSHNQGKAGDGLAVNLYLYDQETDSYNPSVDADRFE